MEEKKSKVVNMKGENTEPKKLTYEQLNNACNQVFQQNQQLLHKIQEINAVNMFKRLDYLFKVVELAATFKDADFVNSCIDEIKEALTPSEESEKDNANK